LVAVTAESKSSLPWDKGSALASGPLSGSAPAKYDPGKMMIRDSLQCMTLQCIAPVYVFKCAYMQQLVNIFCRYDEAPLLLRDSFRSYLRRNIEFLSILIFHLLYCFTVPSSLQELLCRGAVQGIPRCNHSQTSRSGRLKIPTKWAPKGTNSPVLRA
jgi:hypothetical protein